MAKKLKAPLQPGKEKVMTPDQIQAAARKNVLVTD